MKLSEEQLATYARDGVLALAGHFAPDEVAGLRAELDRLGHGSSFFLVTR